MRAWPLDLSATGAGGVQHLGRLLGWGRAMKAILGADDFDAEQAERYSRMASPRRVDDGPAAPV
jgi:hypothetical protein